MKRFAQIIFLVAIALSILATVYFYVASRNEKGSDPALRTRVLEAGSIANSDPDPADVQAGVKPTSSIPLEDNETLLDLYSFNLDFDDEEEQILVIRESDDPSGTIKIVLADYSPFSRKWTRSWKGSTLVTKNKTFQVSINDLIGDHNLNIVCTGMSDANEQTMTIYWKTQDLVQKQTLTFTKVFEQAGSTVLIESSERPDSYKLGQSNAESWPVSVWKADASSGNYLDQLKEQWRWSFLDKAYILASTEQIPGASIARKMAETILDGNEATFKTFLDGTWYKESFDPLSNNAIFITFQSRDESVLFSGEGLIEVYGWESSNPTRYGLYIASRNQSVRNLRRLMDIELASADSINVRVFQDYRIKADISGKWDGRYRRLSEDMAKAFNRAPAMASSTTKSIEGVYESDDGAKLILSGSSFALESGSNTERGVFSQFELSGKNILDMRSEDASGEVLARRSWSFQMSTVKNSDGTTTELLRLEEVRVGILGVEAVQNPTLTFKKR
ncbi:hypothetical protein MASR2M48_01430 [Spirochaetota bacterium]